LLHVNDIVGTYKWKMFKLEAMKGHDKLHDVRQLEVSLNRRKTVNAEATFRFRRDAWTKAWPEH
jgi:hypothetical protein